MYSDIVFPDGNEEAFLLMAKRIGYKAICFVSKPGQISQAYIAVSYAAVYPQHSRITLAQSSSQDRALVERKQAHVIYGFEAVAAKDTLTQRNSGINHVLARLMQKNNVAMAISFRTLLHASNRPLLFGRIMQNIRLARKYKFPVILASFATKPEEMRSPHDLMALLQVLGMHPSEAKAALDGVRR